MVLKLEHASELPGRPAIKTQIAGLFPPDTQTWVSPNNLYFFKFPGAAAIGLMYVYVYIHPPYPVFLHKYICDFKPLIFL